MKCRFEARTIEGIRSIDEMIRNQNLHKTNFLRQYGIQTSVWNDWVRGKKRGFSDLSYPKVKALFDECGV
jgi:hypothetical protein